MERTLDDSANRRLALADGFLAANGILELLLDICGGLVVYPQMIGARLDAELPFLCSEDLLMEAAKAGGDRQLLHEKLRRHAQAAGTEVKQKGLKNDLLDRLDESSPLDRDRLPALLDPRHYVGLAPLQTERFVKGQCGRFYRVSRGWRRYGAKTGTAAHGLCCMRWRPYFIVYNGRLRLKPGGEVRTARMGERAVKRGMPCMA